MSEAASPRPSLPSIFSLATFRLWEKILAKEVQTTFSGSFLIKHLLLGIGATAPYYLILFLPSEVGI